MMVTGATRVLGIIGDPVRHSRSPQMQNRALAEAGLDYVYVPFPVHPEGLAEAVNGFRAAGIHGFNVTVPHKVTILPLLDRLSPEAAEIGAVNTVNNDNGMLVGYNTDGAGLVASLRDDTDFVPQGKIVVVIGAGGAARAAVHACCAAGAARVTIVNRTMASAVTLVEQYRRLFPECALSVRETFTAALPDADLLLNTTSVGMDGVSLAADPSCLPATAVVYDMIYAPPETPLLAAARMRGLRAANGLGMLAAQGERAFAIWTGVPPAPGLMKQVLSDAF